MAETAEYEQAPRAARSSCNIPPAQPLVGPFAWRGQELAQRADWIRRLTASETGEIDAALRQVEARAVPLLEITREAFPLPTLSATLSECSRELEEGRGFVLLRGLPAERYSTEELGKIFWGIGTHLGTAVSQSKKNGEFLGEVRDVGVKLGEPTSRGYRSREHLRFHTDRCDVVGLLCVRTAKSGGASRIVSSVAIHNEILKRRPDLLAQLYQDYYHSRQGEEAPGEAPYYINPIFGICGGRFTSQYSRSYIESAQRFAEVPCITKTQDEALDLLAELAEEFCFHMELAPGDIQLLNNHITYHSRTSYEDHPEPERQRLLLRLWLSVPGSRPLPAGYETLWGRVEAGAVRGGVTSHTGYRNILEYREALVRR